MTTKPRVTLVLLALTLSLIACSLTGLEALTGLFADPTPTPTPEYTPVTPIPFEEITGELCYMRLYQGCVLGMYNLNLTLAEKGQYVQNWQSICLATLDSLYALQTCNDLPPPENWEAIYPPDPLPTPEVEFNDGKVS